MIDQPDIFPSDTLTPRAIVEALDRDIVGQAEAKRCVAVALRNRTRRRQLPEALQAEIVPKNIILIGPTGVGKTEIARRLAALVKAPFIKVEATKYTEVGYIGRDVESMVRDLTERAVRLVREEMTAQLRSQAEARVRDRLLDLLTASIPAPGPRRFLGGYGETAEAQVEGDANETALHGSRDAIAAKLDAGELEAHEIELEVSAANGNDAILGMVGMDEQMNHALRDMMDKMMPSRTRQARMTVADARPILFDQVLDDILDQDQIQREAVTRTEQSGIIFLDELDKIAGRGGNNNGPDVSREGVQRDILPIIEGCSVYTKYGNVRTDHILFIAAGAFHVSKPSDLIPELQGRFPLRVELQALSDADFQRILTEPRHCLVEQYRALLDADGVALTFTDDGVEAMAHAAMELNRESENIGARRLHSILERVLESVAFDAPDALQGAVTIDRAYVQEKLEPILAHQDLSQFIL